MDTKSWGVLVQRHEPIPRGEQKPPMEGLTFEERIVVEINEDREFWLENINFHLENLLEKVNMDNNLQRNMVIHYYTRNHVAKIRIKHFKAKHKENHKK